MPAVLDRITRRGETPTSEDQLIFRAVFDVEVQNVDATDFIVTGGSTATITNIKIANNSARFYDITVSGGDLADFVGTVGLALAPAPTIPDLDTTFNTRLQTFEVIASDPTDPTDAMAGRPIQYLPPPYA